MKKKKYTMEEIELAMLEVIKENQPRHIKDQWRFGVIHGIGSLKYKLGFYKD